MASPRAAGQPASFGFSKDAAAFARRPSFTESLAAAQKKTNPVEPGALRGGAYLLKYSTTGAAHRRFFILHSHYLSYFAKDPGQDTSIPPLGSLDLWSVSEVILDDCVLILTLGQASSGARRQQMGSKTLRSAKQYIRGLQSSVPFAGVAKQVVNVLETARRGQETTTMRLKASSAMEAQLWLQAIRESPFIGSLAAATAEATGGGGEAIEGLGGSAGPNPTIAELRVFVPPRRELIFSSGALSGGEILLRRIPELEGATLTFKMVVPTDTWTVKTVLRPVSAAEHSSQLVTPLGPQASNHVVIVEWERRRTQIRDVVSPVAVVASGLVIGASFVLVGLTLSVIVALACLAGAVWVYIQTSTAGQGDLILRRVFVHQGEAPVPIAMLPPKAATLKASRLFAAPRSEDLNVTLEESQLLVELRERCKDFWSNSANAEQVIKRYGKFLSAWGADLGNLKDPGKRKRAVDVHLYGADFRAVRFLRARKNNLAKAEIMVQESLTWRIALGTDDLLSTFEPPGWLLDYAGSPTFVALKRPEEDAEERFRRFWVRDVDGNLCLFFRQGLLSSRRIYKKLHSNSAYLIKCLVWAAEIGRHDLDRMHQQTKGKIDSTVTAVVDMDGFAVSNQIPVTELVGLARLFFPIFSTSYPELLKRVIVIRAPFLFASVWNALSPFIPPEVLDKIHILSGAVDLDKHILPYIPIENVPAYLGGTLVDENTGDEMCCDRFPASGPFTPDEGARLLVGLEETAVKRT